MASSHDTFSLSDAAPRLAAAVLLTLSGAMHVLPLSAQTTDALSAPAGDVILEVRGTIAAINADDAALFDMEMLEALPPAAIETSTSVTDGVHLFEGVLMRDLLARVGAEGETVSAIALNDYAIDIPIEDFERFDVVLAHSMDGERLLPSDKGPLWIVYPRDQHDQLQDIRYDYRWVWQLYQLEIR
ncbi:molybdopterin-dependent oxidoreductase [Pelagibacterium montanilacus]|uniref:molybdopterin-dependent oxidoreductase n=1 Tax=Pelagibacterium montanilacus TaxID=2185280 RepID=UPI000F8DCC3F|nr:molybdopterin-dependent oxidoreductase [Pelagibacterium montanilacus]